MARTTARSRIREAKAATDTQADDVVVKMADDGFNPSRKNNVRLNPLADLIDDETYTLLQQHRLFDQKALRDYQIRKSYREMREQMSASDAIDKIQQMHPYLQFDTIRKIVYMSKAS